MNLGNVLRSRLATAGFAAILTICVFGLYSTGLRNGLVFDDTILLDGSIFKQFGGLTEFRARMLSYGTFVWIRQFLGEDWVYQRLFNMALHVVTGLGIYGLVDRLVQRALAESTNRSAIRHDTGTVQAAVRMAVLVWALNPVCVYVVAYLIQRSILMATCFAVLGMLAFTLALDTRRPQWYVATAATYALALMSKEHAVTLPLALAAVYVFWRRPSGRQIAGATGALVLLLGLGTLILWERASGIIGTTFDAFSKGYVDDLNRLQPGFARWVYPLSILNQSWLFFSYGFHWAIPNPAWLHIDMQPPFPLSPTSWPQMLGPLMYVAAILGGLWLLVRQRGLWSLAGLALLLPLSLFTTEFVTVWIQDPFVLYRSYLWSIGCVVLLAMVLLQIGTKIWVYVTGLLMAGACAFFAAERITSLTDERSVWSDVLSKTDLNAPPSSVGRWRAPLNLAREEYQRKNPQEALRLALLSIKLGEPTGAAHFNAGIFLQTLKRDPEALSHFDEAGKQGYSPFLVAFHEGESNMVLLRFEEAHAHFERALRSSPPAGYGLQPLLRTAEAANMAQHHDRAAELYTALLRHQPDEPLYTIGLAFAYFGAGHFPQALQVLTPAINKHPTAALRHARATVYAAMGNRAASLADIEAAMVIEPTNPIYLEFKRKLVAAH